MKVGTFFSGIGSPEQALLNLGIKHDIEFACDIDKYARETYLKNFNCKNMYEDITALDMKDLSYVDLLVFGFPCQAFSMAGKRGGFEDTRGTLFYDALRYLTEHKPRYFIAENVKGLLSHDNGKTFQTIIDCLALTTNTQMSLMPFDNLGYHIYYKVLNTKDFGIPQNRERIFIVGIRDDVDNNFRFPKEIPLILKLKDVLQDNPNYNKYKVDNKYYLSNKAVDKIKRHNNKSLNNKVSNCIHSGYYKGGGRDQQYIKVDDKYYLSDKMISGIFKSNFQERKPININKISKCLKVGGDVPCFEVISHSLYPRSSKTNKDGTGHLSKSDGTTYCLDTGNAQAIEKNNKIRRLTPIECERLQGFPDNHTEGVSDTQRYKQCGNSITVNVMEAILKNLLNGHS
jgi:DNA (cytosine-5)-methyltransferase 1